jgi:rhodanese-related sulfurtransferase
MDPQFDGVIFQTHPAELNRRLRYPFPPFKVLDARSRDEFRRGHVPGAIPVAGVDLATVFPRESGRIELFVVGKGPLDPRVRAVSLGLLDLGAHRIVELTGGMFEWERAGYETEFERGAGTKAATPAAA